MDAPLTLADEVFLLLTAESGRREHTMGRRYALTTAVLCELMLRERIALSDDGHPRVTVADPTPVGEAAMDQVLEAVAGRLAGRRVGQVLAASDGDVTRAVGAGLVARGILAEKPGFFGTGWPTVDPEPKRAVRARLAGAVLDPPRASIQDAVELGILKAAQAGYVAIRPDLQGLGRGETLRRIDALSSRTAVARILRRLANRIAAEEGGTVLAG